MLLIPYFFLALFLGRVYAKAMVRLFFAVEPRWWRCKLAWLYVEFSLVCVLMGHLGMYCAGL
jgi:hypothetical protein